MDVLTYPSFSFSCSSSCSINLRLGLGKAPPKRQDVSGECSQSNIKRYVLVVRKCHGGIHTWDDCFPCFVEPQLLSSSLYLAQVPPNKSINDGDFSTGMTEVHYMRIRSEWKLRSYLSRVRTGCAGTKSSSLSGARTWSSNLFHKAPPEKQGVRDEGSLSGHQEVQQVV